MNGAAADRCPRCSGGFRCGVNDAGACPCTTVTLGAELQRRLRETFEGCLCLHCLRELAAADTVTPQGAIAFPETRGMERQRSAP